MNKVDHACMDYNRMAQDENRCNVIILVSEQGRSGLKALMKKGFTNEQAVAILKNALAHFEKIK
jgi:hypothetical protein